MLIIRTIVLRLSDIVLRSVYFNDEITWYSIFHVCMMIIQLLQLLMMIS